MTNRHPHRRKILGAISAGLLAVFGGCYLISDDGDEDVDDDREGTNETDPNETDGDSDWDPNDTDLTTDPELNTSYPDDC